MKIDKKTIMLIVLGVVALVVVVRAILPSRKSGPAPVAVKQATPSTPKQGLGAAMLAEKIKSLPTGRYAAHIATVKESDIAFQKSGFKNPMTPAEGESEKAQSWVPTSVDKAPAVVDSEAEIFAKDYSIEGIVWNEKDPLALVNDQVVGIGEELEDGAVVTEITRDTVRFSRNGKRYYLVLREE